MQQTIRPQEECLSQEREGKSQDVSQVRSACTSGYSSNQPTFWQMLGHDKKGSKWGGFKAVEAVKKEECLCLLQANAQTIFYHSKSWWHSFIQGGWMTLTLHVLCYWNFNSNIFTRLLVWCHGKKMYANKCDLILIETTITDQRNMAHKNIIIHCVFSNYIH